MGVLHLEGLGPCGFELHQWPRADARAVAGGFLPLSPNLNQFRPKREGPALHRLGGMDRATALDEKMAVGSRGHAQAHAAARTVDVPLLELPRRQRQECGGAGDVGFAEVDKSLALAARGASGLAPETEAVNHGAIVLWAGGLRRL